MNKSALDFLTELSQEKFSDTFKGEVEAITECTGVFNRYGIKVGERTWKFTKYDLDKNAIKEVIALEMFISLSVGFKAYAMYHNYTKNISCKFYVGKLDNETYLFELPKVSDGRVVVEHMDNILVQLNKLSSN